MKRIIATGLCVFMLLAALSGCGTKGGGLGEIRVNSSATVSGPAGGETMTQPPATDDPPAPPQTSSDNLVDPRFELVALIFRLAGHPEYVVRESDRNAYGAAYAAYHQALAAFTQYADHPAVTCAATLDISGSNIFQYVLYIKEDLSGLDDISSLVSPFARCWQEKTAKEFWPLALDFYRETGFASFYQENIPFYKTLTEPFAQDAVISTLDMGWFAAVATQYDADKKDHYRYMVSPSIHGACSSAWNDDTAYAAMAALLGQQPSFQWNSEFLVHEYNHSFCTGPAMDALMLDAQFEEWIDAYDSDAGFYKDSLVISVEYLVRAYTLLYFADHGYDEAVPFLFARDKDLGFTYIEDVYAMVREKEGRT